MKEGYLAFKQVNPFIRDAKNDGAAKLLISFDPHGVTFYTHRNPEDGEKIIVAAMDGSRKENTVDGLASIALASAEWVSDNMLKLTLRMVETCNEQYFDFTFDGDDLKIEVYSNHVFGPMRKNVVTLKKA